MIAVVRISGFVKVRQSIEETMDRLRLRRKYACILINDNAQNLRGMVRKIRNFVAYGEIDEETLVALLKERGRKIGKGKVRIENPEKAAKELLTGKKSEEIGIKPFFRLHSPRGGIDSKIHFGRRKGVLGDNGKAINKLIMRML